MSSPARRAGDGRRPGSGARRCRGERGDGGGNEKKAGNFFLKKGKRTLDFIF